MPRIGPGVNGSEKPSTGSFDIGFTGEKQVSVGAVIGVTGKNHIKIGFELILKIRENCLTLKTYFDSHG